MLDKAREEEEVVLWFEHDLFCLVHLLYLLTRLSKCRRITLIWCPQPLGTQTEEELFNLFQSRAAVLPAMTHRRVAGVARVHVGRSDVAQSLSRAPTSPTFRSFATAFACTPRVFRRRATDSAKWSAARSKGSTPALTDFVSLFTQFDRNPPRFGFGDGEFLRHLKHLASVAVPVITIIGEEKANPPKALFSITPAGRNVIDGNGRLHRDQQRQLLARRRAPDARKDVAMGRRPAADRAEPACRLVRFEAADGVALAGLLYEPRRATKRAIIWLHGGGGASVFESRRTNLLGAIFIAQASPSSRSTTAAPASSAAPATTSAAPHSNGSATAWPTSTARIRELWRRGYRDITLAGHSTGANKIAVYDHYKPRNRAKRYVLLAGGDDTGLLYAQLGARRFNALLAKAKAMIKARRGDELAPRIPGQTMLSWRALYDVANPDGDYNVFPFFEAMTGTKLSRRPLFRYIRAIRKPSLYIYGDRDEYCFDDVPRCVAILAQHVERARGDRGHARRRSRLQRQGRGAGSVDRGLDLIHGLSEQLSCVRNDQIHAPKTPSPSPRPHRAFPPPPRSITFLSVDSPFTSFTIRARGLAHHRVTCVPVCCRANDPTQATVTITAAAGIDEHQLRRASSAAGAAASTARPSPAPPFSPPLRRFPASSSTSTSPATLDGIGFTRQGNAADGRHRRRSRQQ